jgi:hypothetical protein
MNDITKGLVAGFLVGAVLCGGAVFWIYQTSLRENGRIIAGMEAEIKADTDRLADIQGAVDRVGGSLAGSSDEAGDIADGVGGVVTGINDITRVIGELIEFFEYVEGVISGGGFEGP